MLEVKLRGGGGGNGLYNMVCVLVWVSWRWVLYCQIVLVGVNTSWVRFIRPVAIRITKQIELVWAICWVGV